jgi:hypothetical protein
MTGKRTDMYRLKAQVCEQRAVEASDLTSKRDWEELAIEWHTMASVAAKMAGETSQIEFA